MNVKQLTLSHGITVNLGDYQSERFDLSLTLEVQDGETARGLSIEAHEAINHLLADELRARMFQPELEGASYLDKVKAAPGALDAKLRALHRHPFWNWIVRLAPEMAQEMETVIRDSVERARPEKPDYFGKRPASMGLIGNRDSTMPDEDDPIADITDDDYLPDSASEE